MNKPSLRRADRAPGWCRAGEAHACRRTSPALSFFHPWRSFTDFTVARPGQRVMVDLFFAHVAPRIQASLASTLQCEKLRRQHPEFPPRPEDRASGLGAEAQIAAEPGPRVGLLPIDAAGGNLVDQGRGLERLARLLRREPSGGGRRSRPRRGGRRRATPRLRARGLRWPGPECSGIGPSRAPPHPCL